MRRSATDEQDVAGLLAGLPAILDDGLRPGTLSAVRRVQVHVRPASAGAGSSGWSSTRPSPACPSWTWRSCAGAVEVLSVEEEKVSTHRRTVQRVVDVLRSGWPAATGTAPPRCRSCFESSP